MLGFTFQVSLVLTFIFMFVLKSFICLNKQQNMFKKLTFHFWVVLCHSTENSNVYGCYAT